MGGRPVVRARVLLAALVPVCAALGVLLGATLPGALLWLRPHAPPLSAEPLDDQTRVLNIVALLEEGYATLPVAPDGRLDVYRLVADGIVPPEEAEVMFRSRRSGRGPDRGQIARGDYAPFPYARQTAAGLGDPRAPLLWDAGPDASGRRVVAWRNHEVRFVGEEDWDAVR